LKETRIKHLALSNNILKACDVTQRVEYVEGWGGAADVIICHVRSYGVDAMKVMGMLATLN